MNRLRRLAAYCSTEGVAGVTRRLVNHLVWTVQPVTEAVIWYPGYLWNPWRATGHPPRNCPGATRAAYEALLCQLSESGIRAETVQVDWAAYKDYMAVANYPKDYYSSWILEKSLEHFLSLLYLDLKPDDLLIDVASQFSPFPEIAQRLYNCTVYSQDLDYPPGRHGRQIGGDAAQMPVQDGFATKMTLHCSFEHFEGDSDIGFLREAARVLRPGGRVCILPLYLNDEYCILTNPYVQRRGIGWDKEATVRYVRGWLGGRHGRFYDVTHFKRRVLDNCTAFCPTLYFVEIPDELLSKCYVRFILVLEKLRREAGEAV